MGSRLSAQRHRNPRENIGHETAFRKHRPDYSLPILMSILLVLGAVVVFAIGPGLTNGTNLPENYYSVKQIISIILGIIGFGVASFIPINRWKKLQYPIIGLAIIVAFLVRIIGDEIYGAHRWIQIAGFSFQAAELIKLAIVLWLADYLSSRQSSFSQYETHILRNIGILIGAIAVVVAGLQSDLGSAAVMMAVVGMMGFVSGMPMKKLLTVGSVVMLIGLIAIVSTPYRRERVATFLNPAADCQAEGYQACQALITIGSGGMFGKGLGKSVQAYGYLPKPENDSIFAIVAEKFGFVGTVAVISVFWLLFRKISAVARSAPTEYSKLLVTGVLVWLSTQMFINVGAMVGLLPLKGITLPFVSYGGTSVIFVMIAMGIVFNISRYTELDASHNKKQFNDKQSLRIRYSGARRI